MKIPSCAILLFTLMRLSGPAYAGGENNIRSFDWVSYFNHKYSHCLGYFPQKPAVYLYPISYHDFDGDGREEALITGSSCDTGTAGPDIHSVFKLDDHNNISEISIDSAIENAKVTGIPMNLIGNRNWNMVVKGNLLCNQFYDGSGRETPIEQCYELKSGKFVMVTITYAPTFKTSFDCRQAKTDREIVVCGNASVARLDLELHEVYQNLLRSLGVKERQEVIARQKEWLSNADKWSAYKWCCEEIVNDYSKRINELRQYGLARRSQSLQPPLPAQQR